MVLSSIIDDFRPLDSRNDAAGDLWEKFLFIERQKMLAYNFKRANGYFWRTYAKAEMDYLEETSGTITGFEFKYKAKRVKHARAWESAFPNAPYSCVNKENYLPFLQGK